MQNRSVKLVDSTGGVLATAKVADDAGIYTGTIDLQCAPSELRAIALFSLPHCFSAHDCAQYFGP